MNTVIVYQAYNSAEAHHIKNLLESADINCMIKNENINTILNFGGMQKDFEVFVMVYEKDYDAAREIIDDLKARREKNRCNNCGSEDLKMVTEGGKIKQYITMFISFLFMIPIAKFDFHYECQTCGNEQQ